MVTTDTCAHRLIYSGFFTDVVLQKLIDSAIVKNYDMQIAVKNIEASQLLFKQVKWNYVPERYFLQCYRQYPKRPSDNSLDWFKFKPVQYRHKAY